MAQTRDRVDPCAVEREVRRLCRERGFAQFSSTKRIFALPLIQEFSLNLDPREHL
jgi:hypothetical protein